MIQEEAPRAAKFLPKEIVEAFKQNPIGNDPIDTSNDEVQEVKQIMKNSNNLPTQNVINEQTTNGVDYGLPENLETFDYMTWMYKQYGIDPSTMVTE